MGPTCWDCRNQNDFIEVSARVPEWRTIAMERFELVKGDWQPRDDRESGLYCAQCGGRIEWVGLPGDLGDDRIEFVPPDRFDAELIADELLAKRSDDEWVRLELPAVAARTVEPPVGLSPPLRAALARTGRERLYTHQAEAIEAALAGDHTIQATSAGSGKSLGFLLPVLQELSENAGSTAIMLFPMLALAADQIQALRKLGDVTELNESTFQLDLGDGARPIIVARYDSTNDNFRHDARKRARLLIMTPDTLHASALRYATHAYKDGSRWQRVFAGLRYVVIDEVHAYKGVFGSNIAQVLRRTRRVANFYGAQPQFLTASATIGNAVEHIERLTGVTGFRLIDDDGSPRRRRVVMICNPQKLSGSSVKARKSRGAAPLTDQRTAPQTIAISVLADVALGSKAHLPVRTICFARSRSEVMLTAGRARNRLRDQDPVLADAVAHYTAQMTAEDRESAEMRLRNGATLAIVSTNALELGIDIPDLSIAVLVGYPGQISAFRQRAGRCGRAGEGLVVLVVGDDPLQQYLVQRPGALRELLDSQPEDVIVNPDAPALLRRFGIDAASADLGGICAADVEYFGEAVLEALGDVSDREPVFVDGRGERYFALVDGDRHFDPQIRSIAGEGSYSVITRAPTKGRRTTGQTKIGVVSGTDAPRDAFVGAMFADAKGDLHEVVTFDEANRVITCEPRPSAEYHTSGVVISKAETLDVLETPRIVGPAELTFERIVIRRNVHSYRKIYPSGRDESAQIVGKLWGERRFVTNAVRLALDPSSFADAESRDATVRAVEHLLLSFAPAVVSCDPVDFDATSEGTSIWIYDCFGEGLGMIRPVYERFDEIVELAHRAVVGCPCKAGCPSCVVLSRRPEGNHDLSKAGAVAALGAMRA